MKKKFILLLSIVFTAILCKSQNCEILEDENLYKKIYKFIKINNDSCEFIVSDSLIYFDYHKSLEIISKSNGSFSYRDSLVNETEQLKDSSAVYSSFIHGIFEGTNAHAQNPKFRIYFSFPNRFPIIGCKIYKIDDDNDKIKYCEYIFRYEKKENEESDIRFMYQMFEQ